jgi:hypothetical protein
MIISITVSDEIVRVAGVRGQTVIDFVESLIDSGMSTAKQGPVVSSAIDRIRALRTTGVDTKR